jgi:hypothetical protein
MVSNIHERRAYIKSLLQEGKRVDVKKIIEMFDSSYPAVMNDLSVIGTGEPAYRKSLTMGQNTRARKLGVSGLLEEYEWQDILRAHNYSCAICGSTEDISIDHIIPLSKGGTNTADNIQPLCRSCNSRKGNRQ